MKKLLKYFLSAISSVAVMLLLCLTVSAETDGVFTYSVSDDKATVTAVDSSVSGDVEIPETLGGYEVTAIGSSAFSRCFYMDEVFIPSTVTTIAADAFNTAWCTKFTVDENSLYFSNDEYGALFNKEKTVLYRYPVSSENESYTVPSTVTALVGRPFQHCQFGLKHVTFSDGVTELGSCCFFGAASVETVDLPSTLETIGSNCFAMCYALKEITIPLSVTSIEESAFTYCDALRTFCFPENITQISSSVLSDCPALERVYIPQSVTSVKSNAFGGCPALTTVYYEGTEDEWNNITDSTPDNDYNAEYNSADIHYSYDITLYDNIDTYMAENIVYVKGYADIKSGNNNWHFWNEYAAEAQVIVIDGSFTTVEENTFSDFPNVTTLLIYSPDVTLKSSSFNNCPSLKTVIDFSGANYSADTFNSCGDIQLFTASAQTENINNCNVIPYEFRENSIYFAGDVTVDSYTFFDLAAAMCLEYENIENIKFDRFTCEDIAFYYYDSANYSYIPIDGNSFEDAQLSVFTDSYETGRVDITFNSLCNGISDGSITDFYLVAADSAHDDMLDTEIEIKDEENNEESFIVRALKWIVSLLNKLFALMSKLRG